MNMPLVSIIIPIKQYDKNIERVFVGIKNQTYKNLEVIIILADENPKLSALTAQYGFNLYLYGKGKSASRNFGASKAGGEYLFHLDDDMFLDERVVAECVALAEQAKAAAVAVPERYGFKNKISEKIISLEKRIVFSDKNIEAPRFIKKSVYEKLGGINEALDPIDEGDLKAKLEEAGIRYVKTKSYIDIIGNSETLALANRAKRLYKRGQKMLLFNALHPSSKQLRPLERLGAYRENSALLFRNHIFSVLLIALKIGDLIVLKIGGNFPSKQDRIAVKNLKNKIVFEKESDTYQKEFFEDSNGAKFVDLSEKNIVHDLLQDIEKNQVLRILDIGAGGGRWSKLLLDNFPNAKVVAYDLSVGMAENLRKKFSAYQSRFEVCVGDMQNLPFSDNEFDIVLSIRAIKYANDYQKVFGEIGRVLKPNGRSIIELPYLNFVYRLIRFFKIFGNLSEYANRINLFNISEIISVLKKNNFYIEDLNVRFAIPATVYKKANRKISLAVLNIFNYILPKNIFGRSIFLNLRGCKTAEAMDNGMVSVVIVNWNGMKWLDTCLASLSRQTFKNMEIIVVDNNSGDDSVGFIKNNYPSVRVIESRKNSGFAGGNNLGINQSRGDYVLMLNSDTWIGDDFIEKLFNSLKSRGLDVIAPKEMAYDKKALPFSDERTIDIFGHPYFAKDKGIKNFYLQGVCLLFRKSAYFRTGGLDNDFFMYFEETDWFWRLNLLQIKFDMDKEVEVYHAGSGTAGKGLQYNTFLWRNQNALQMLLKNYRALSLFWILPLYFLQNIFEMSVFAFALRPEIAKSYLEGWIFNIVRLKKTLAKRKKIQHNRLVSDSVVISKMYFGPAKLRHLFSYIKKYE